MRQPCLWFFYTNLFPCAQSLLFFYLPNFIQWKKLTYHLHSLANSILIQWCRKIKFIQGWGAGKARLAQSAPSMAGGPWKIFNVGIMVLVVFFSGVYFYNWVGGGGFIHHCFNFFFLSPFQVQLCNSFIPQWRNHCYHNMSSRNTPKRDMLFRCAIKNFLNQNETESYLTIIPSNTIMIQKYFSTCRRSICNSQTGW